MCSHVVKRLMLLSVLGSAALSAQTAGIAGRVVDQTGAVVPEAKVTATHVTTGVSRSAQTNEVGYYGFPSLQPGEYNVSVAREGFRTAARNGVRIDVNQDLRLDFSLDLGTAAETVVVQSEAPLVNLSDATVGKVISHTSMVSLPLNGRNALSLVMLTPSVRFNASSPSGFADRGATLAAFQVNGGPSGANNIELDGTTNVNSRLGDVNVNPAVDAIEEFKVQSAVVPAESGFTLGGIVSLITRSGGNAFHGTLYEFLRNDKLDARNTFALRKAPLRYNQYGGSLGGRVIRDKTFFFANYEEWRLSLAYTATGTTPTAAQRMGDFSSERDARGALITIYDPATTQVNPAGGGFLRQPFAGNRIPANRLDPVAQNILQFYPLPNRTPDDPFTNLNNFSANLATSKNARQINTKVDQYFSAANHAAFRFTLWAHYDDQANNGAGIFPSLLVRQRTDRYRNYNYNLSDQHTFSPSLVNDFRAGVSSQPFVFTPLNYNEGWPAKLGFPSTVPNLIIPIVQITGFQQIPTSFLGTIGNIGLQTYQVADSLTWIRGRHTVKFGADLRRYNTNLNLCQQCNGTFSFTSRLTANPQSLAGTGAALASFLVGTAASATIDYNAGVSYQNYSYSLFAQDDWKVTPRLTLNLGLRWDYQQAPMERNNNLSNFNPDATDPNLKLQGRMEYAGVDFGTRLQDPDYNDFGPRIGFAWDVRGTGRTVVRGGYGMYYAQSAIFANDYATLGFRPNITTYSPPGGAADLPALTLKEGFPFAPNPPLGPKLGPSAFVSQNVSTQERNGRTPYSQQYTLSVQQQVRGVLFDAAYSGNKGTNLRGVNWDLNQLDPKNLALGASLLDQVPNPYAGRVAGAFGGATIQRQQLLRPFPYYGTINVNQPHYASSVYHSLLLSAQKRFDSGVEFLASFTFGKLISDAVIGANFGTGLEGVTVGGNQDGKFNRRLDRSIDPTDSAKRLVLSGLYQLPFGKGRKFSAGNGVVNTLIGGWQLNGIAVMQDGLPLVVRGANNNAANRPNSTGVSAALPPDQRTRYRWFDTTQFVNPPAWTYGNVGRALPDVRGPGIFNVDASIIKDTRLTERVNLQFRAEAFNALNHVNYMNPNVTFVPGADGRNASGSFGVISSARDSRIGQMALKLIF